MRTLDKKRLLLIEDDQTIAELLAYNLRQAGYEVLQESDGRAGLGTALACEIDLALIDLMLPELDGMEVSKEVARKKPGVPIIMLTATTERASMLQGFESGADDYVTKPFDLDELLARIAARLRRSAVSSADATSPASLIGLTLEADTHLLRSATGSVFLKPKEYELLGFLLSEPGHLFRREEIAQRVWHQRYLASSRTIDVHIRHLRAKLESISAEVGIFNVRGVGYRIAERDAPPTR